MKGTIDQINGAHLLDYGQRLRWELEQERQELDYQARVASWVASKMIGRTFDSLDSLKEAAHTIAIDRHGELSERQLSALNKGCVALWAGILEARFLRERAVRYHITTEPHTVSFHSAA